MTQKQTTVGVMFGGRSAEHEISVITALQAIQAIDPIKYRVVPIYIALNGKWYTGEPLLQKAFYKELPQALEKVQEVTLLPDPSISGLLYLTQKGTFSRKEILPIDIYFLAFHGPFGEDGCIQGLLELADVPYTGCGVIASAIAMHKYHCKIFLSAHGIPVLPATVVSREATAKQPHDAWCHIKQTPGLEGFPLFVKPAHLGSSIGISIAHNREELFGSLAKAFRYDDEAIVEPCVTDLMEINVAVLDGDTPIASVVEIPLSSGGQMLTYEDKYLRGANKTSGHSQEGMASLTRIIDPSHLDPSFKQQVIDSALKAFSLLKCSGVARFDFIFDIASEKLYFNELNPIPGSLAFYLWEKSKPLLLYTEVIHRMLRRAQERKSKQLALQRTFGFRALI